jgi:hypothetical protein
MVKESSVGTVARHTPDLIRTNLGPLLR